MEQRQFQKGQRVVWTEPHHPGSYASQGLPAEIVNVGPKRVGISFWDRQGRVQVRYVAPTSLTVTTDPGAFTEMP